MKLRVTYLDGGSEEVIATASARRAFEAEYNMPLFDAVASGMSYWADFLAYRTLVQTKGEERGFDEWMDTVLSIQYGAPESKLRQLAEVLGIDVEEGEPAADPTGGAAADRSRAASSKPRSTRAKASKG